MYNPLLQLSNIKMAFSFDGNSNIELIFFNADKRITQKGEFKIYQAEEISMAVTHGNQTLFAMSAAPMLITKKQSSKNILLRVPLKPNVDDIFATLDFQNAKGDFIAGHQKMNCVFDSPNQKTAPAKK